jgi:hypothetical protein
LGLQWLGCLCRRSPVTHWQVQDPAHDPPGKTPRTRHKSALGSYQVTIFDNPDKENAGPSCSSSSRQGVAGHPSSSMPSHSTHLLWQVTPVTARRNRPVRPSFVRNTRLLPVVQTCPLRARTLRRALFYAILTSASVATSAVARSFPLKNRTASYRSALLALISCWPWGDLRLRFAIGSAQIPLVSGPWRRKHWQNSMPIFLQGEIDIGAIAAM